MTKSIYSPKWGVTIFSGKVKTGEKIFKTEREMYRYMNKQALKPVRILIKQTDFASFFAQFNGQSVEVVDPTNKDQCFDLAVAWCLWLGLPITIFNGLLYASYIWAPSTPIAIKSFDFIPNTPDAIPIAGDMAVWDGGYNGYWLRGVYYKGAGHVGMVTNKANLDTFDCFEQNDPSGTVSHVKTYNYDYVLGWLRKKGTPGQTDKEKLAVVRWLIHSTQSDKIVRDKLKLIIPK